MATSAWNKAGRKKLRLKEEAKLIQLFANLLANGFSLSESLDFLERAQLLESPYARDMRASLLEGQGLAQMMKVVGFSDMIVTQLTLADYHGNLTGSLDRIQAYLTSLSQIRKKLVEVATYPLILMGFLILIMLGLRHYLLPQLEEGNLATSILSYFPQIFLGALLLSLVSGLVFWIWAKRQQRLKLLQGLSRLPLAGEFIRLYLTAYYAREWGNLLGQGLELSQVVRLMQDQDSQLFREIGSDLELALLAGWTFQDKVRTYAFFKPELALMIEYGEVKSRLGKELDIYAQESWEAFFTKINRTTQLIQPLIFLLVALIIVMIYAAMLLPMYQNMEITL